MQTNRLRFQDIDQSFYVGTPTSLTGACIIKAIKGTKYPTLISKGDYTSLLNLYGTPSSTYKGLDEAMQYLGEYSLWVSAPSDSTSTYGGVYLTKYGTFEKFYNIVEGAEGKPDLTSKLVEVSSSILGSMFPWPGAAAGTTNYATPAVSYLSKLSKIKLTTGSVSHTFLVSGTGVVCEEDATVTYSDVIAPTGIITFVVADVNADFIAFLSGTARDTSYTLYYDISSDVVMALYQNSQRVASGTFSDIKVDNTTNEYPYKEYSFTIGGSDWGTASTTAVVCDKTYTFTPASSTAAAYATALKAAIRSLALPAGFSVSSTSTNAVIIIQATKGQLPSIVPAISTVTAKLVATITLPAIFDVTLSTILLFNGKPIIVGTGTAAAAGEAIIASYAAPTGYVCTFADPTLTISYAPSIPDPVIVMPNATTALSLATSPVANKGIAVLSSTNNTLKFTYAEINYLNVTGGGSFTVSPDPLAENSFGESTYAENVLAGNNFIGVQVFSNSLAPLTGYTWNKKSATVAGTRDLSDNSVVAAWYDAFGDTQQDVNIFFDPENISSIPAIMASLRADDFPFSTFISGIKVASTSANTSNTRNVTVQQLLDARANLPMTIGLAYYCNEFRVSEPYTGTVYDTIPVGSVSAMLTRIMYTKLGGAAPMFTNEGNPSIGGQLSRAVNKQKYNFSADNLDQLDGAGINPIILDNLYGLMMTSQRTSQSPLTLTDWSYLGHQMAFDLFKKEVRQQVMLPQIGKLIDPYHMKMRREQTQIILNKRLTGATAIWTDGNVQVEEVNTPEMKAQNTFVIKVRVKVTSFSELVLMVFSSVGQTSFVS